MIGPGGFMAGPKQSNPNNCATCDHKQNPDGGHCYMFRSAPNDACGQHTGRRLTAEQILNKLTGGGMNDRELLELAAKAAGFVLDPNGRNDGAFLVIANHARDYIWPPLKDDGCALRLAVKMELWIGIGEGSTTVSDNYGRFRGCVEEEHGDDADAATRRAIVRAAAEIGKAMQ